MNFNNMNIHDFIEHIITHDNITDILDSCKTQSEKGFIFERLFDIVIKFGFCDIFPNSKFNHLIGNSNNGKLKILKNFNKYLTEKVISGNASGCSDITLQNKNDETFIFISSKYPKSNEDIKNKKSVGYYDIQKILAIINENKHIYKKYEIYLVVPNKKKILDKVLTANNSSNYITKYMKECNILDEDNLNKYILLFKQDIINKMIIVPKKKSLKNNSDKHDINFKIDLDYINDRINKEICIETIDNLKDVYLINEYKECKSVQNKIKKLELILEKYEIKKKDLIINDYLLELIPAGTKGVIRGNKFNNIVKNIINNLKLDNERFEICFEKQCKLNITTEIPDWYIFEKLTGKVIIGMNQLDLWGGGQQINRGFKYLIDNKNNTEKCKLLCVVCNKIKFISDKNKAYKLFEVGYLNDTLCHIKNIETIINNYFNLTTLL
jgi:hypothetical protein